MAKKNKLVKSKSIYTIKKQHSVTNNSVIYENDHVTIVPNDGIYDDEMVLFSDSNFKYRVNTTQSSKKRHNRGEYIKPEGSDSEVWTLDTISGSSTQSEESKIVLKPNYSSLKDFAYYGSAVELIKATVNNVILNFPGGLYYYGSKAPQVKVGNTTYYLISNEFNIDCWTGGGTIASGDVKNPMRILAASYMNYTVGSGTTECVSPKFTSASTCPNSIIGTVNFGAGYFPVYMDGEGKKYLVSKSYGTAGSVIIKPKQEFVDKFWNEIDDFTRVLLNRDTSPIYKSVFETPYSDETGFYYQNKAYVWPTFSGTTVPDITTGAFQGYLESLIDLATFHDEYDSDNIWRMMTHDAIKNMDWTFTSKKGDEETDLSDFDTTGIGAMIRIYGRQFDDIKRYADNIKNTNTISYDEKGNSPDYFLSDTIENDGWEAFHTSPFGGENTNIISGTVKGSGVTLYVSEKTPSYVNSTFQRRLALSSNYIQSMKGTRRGIETVLGMFGYTPNSASTPTSAAGFFDVEEYVMITKSGLSYRDGVVIRGYVENVYEDDDFPHLMYGYPVALVTPGNEDLDEYLVPWFDMKVKNPKFYFQGYGGWGKMASKKINLPSLTEDDTLDGGTIPIYSETQSYMRFAKDIDEMLSQSHTNLYENIICYVTDISNIESVYKDEDGNPPTNGEYSHYFSLKNVALATHCGFISNDLYNCYGWKNISLSEINEMSSSDGKRVVYLESIITNYKGNNPHVGHGKYDDGSTYLEYFTHLFKDQFENGEFDYIKDEEADIYSSASTFGFTIERVKDNKKCAFFNDYSTETDLEPYDDENVDNVTDWNASAYTGITFPDTSGVTGGLADETQANGIINIKKLVINFGVGENIYLTKYIQDVVLKYLEQMIPSTAILEYRFDNVAAVEAEETNMGGGFFNFMETAHAAVDGEDDTITVWREYPLPINEIE